MVHFDYFCDKTKDIKDDNGDKKYCSGSRFITKMQGDTYACFNYNEN